MTQALHVGHQTVYHQIWGFTPERKFNQKTEDWDLVWEQHNLGLTADLTEARKKADEWRQSLVGLYE